MKTYTVSKNGFMTSIEADFIECGKDYVTFFKSGPGLEPILIAVVRDCDVIQSTERGDKNETD